MTKCITCDRREATPTEWDTVNEGERPDLCFGEHLGCSAHRVDWRERALVAEKERDEAREDEASVAATLADVQERYSDVIRCAREAQLTADEAMRLLAKAGGDLLTECDAARSALSRLIDAHLSASDTERQRGMAEAVETRKGWGM